MSRSRLVFSSLLLAALIALGAGSFYLTPVHADDTDLSPAERADLERQYAELQKEIAAEQVVLDKTRAQKASLKGDVTALTAEIAKAEAQIKQQNLQIGALGKQINAKTTVINQLTGKINQGREALASLLRRTDQIDDLSVVEVAFAADNAFQLFEDADQMASVQAGLRSEFTVIRSAKAETETQRQQLADKQNQTKDAEQVVQTKKQSINNDKTQKNQLLAITTNQESQYQAVLADRQAKAAAISARLFPLRDAGGIQFGTAVAYAKTAGAKTGVRPALILAFLSQESDLGKNVGNCYVTDLSSGDGKGKNTGTPFSGVMKAPRDTVPFESITKALGVDWHTAPVSCPQQGGYGGAMGPAQFIPSTWKLLAPRIAAALGTSGTPSPWNPQTAIMANAIYIADLGASAQTYTAERNAACKYFSGSSCTSGWVASYGDSVIAKANSYQNDIDFLAKN